MNETHKNEDDNIENAETGHASGPDAERESDQSAANPFEIAARQALSSGNFLSESEENALEENAEIEDDDEAGDFDEEFDDDETGEADDDDESDDTDAGDDEAEADFDEAEDADEIDMVEAIALEEAELENAELENSATGGSDGLDEIDEDSAEHETTTLGELEIDEQALVAGDGEEVVVGDIDEVDLSDLVEPPAEVLAGTIALVGVPIGNRDDITLRAVRTLQAVDVVICEDFKTGARLLRNYNISKKLIEMNEHNEESAADEVIAMLRRGKRVAVISDAGLPLLADPGRMLMRKLSALGVQPKIIPGVSSVMTGLMASGFTMDGFDFVGFLPRKPDERRSAAQALAGRERTLAILETPYRLRSLLAALAEAMPNRRAAIAINLTTPFEATIRGTLSELAGKFATKKFKGEFVVVLDRLLPAERRRAVAPETRMPAVADDAEGIEEMDLRPAGWQKPQRDENEGGWNPVKKERTPFVAGPARRDDARGTDRRQGGDRPRGEGSGRPEHGGQRNERGGDRDDRRAPKTFGERGNDRGGWSNERPERREHSGDRPERGGERGGGFNRGGASRPGGFNRGGAGRPGGFERPSGPRREGGFERGGQKREGGFERPSGPRREGGFERGGQRREGGFERPSGPRREGGFERGGQRREGGFERPSGPRREGGFERPSGPRREGGFERPSGPRREGGFERGGPRREGGFERPGGFNRGGGGPNRGGGGFNRGAGGGFVRGGDRPDRRPDDAGRGERTGARGDDSRGGEDRPKRDFAPRGFSGPRRDFSSRGGSRGGSGGGGFGGSRGKKGGRKF